MTHFIAPTDPPREPNACQVTLVGPASPQRSRNFLGFRPWSRAEWRKITVQLHIGTEGCPDWDHANLCLTAINDLIKLSDGFLTDEVVEALRAHLTVVHYESFRGPSRFSEGAIT